MEEEKKNKSTGKTVAIIILVVLLLGAVGYICYDKGIIFQNTEKESKQSNTKIDKKSKEDTKDKNEIKELDLSKPINNNGVSYSNPSPLSNLNDELGLSMDVNSDLKSVTLKIDWAKFGPISGTSAYSPSVESYQITGFSEKINSVFVGHVGQDATGTTLFYLMNNGTVEYTSMFNSQLGINYTYNYSSDGRVTGEPYFVTNGIVNGVSDVIKLYSVSASAEQTSGWATTIGAKADGSFYDLGDIITK